MKEWKKKEIELLEKDIHELEMEIGFIECRLRDYNGRLNKKRNELAVANLYK